MTSSVADKLMDKLAKKTTLAGLPARSDLYVADVQRIDPIKCKVLLGYTESGGGIPTVAQVQNYFEHTFKNKVVAQTGSMVNHPGDSAISLLATLNAPSRPLSDMADMVRVSAATYMDENTNHLWHVVDTGQMKYLSRQAEENIAEIIEARKARLSRKEARFDKLKTAAPMAMAGDQVKFMSPQNVIMLGEVTSISDAKATISANGSSISVDRQAIIQVVERSKKAIQSDKGTLEDYFTKAFGDPAYAKQLSNKETQEPFGLGSTVPSTPSTKAPVHKDEK